MFHLELRQFPHSARAFNLTREQLDVIVRPLAIGRPVALNDRRWNPEKTKIAVYEGPELPIEEMGMGRGWGNVTKDGEDVTDRVLAEARREVESPPVLDALKDAVLARAADGPVGFEQLLGLVALMAPDADANQRIELAARTAWELLRDGRTRVVAAGGEQTPQPSPATTR
jgi:hypothetical protein